LAGFAPRYTVSAIYLCVVIPLDICLGADYCFLGDLPSDKIPPFVAALGPWPECAFVLVALAAAAFLVAGLPWQLSDRHWRQRSATQRLPTPSAVIFR